MRRSNAELEVQQIVDLVTEIAKQKAAEQSAARALENARRAIRIKGQFIPKKPGIRKSLRVCF